MIRIEFKLTMPGRNTWNGKWSGDDKNYTIVKSVSEAQASLLFEGPSRKERSWSYAWADGWCAVVTARRLTKGERLRKSDGFCGYEWMVNSIISRGSIKADHEVQA